METGRIIVVRRYVTRIAAQVADFANWYLRSNKVPGLFSARKLTDVLRTSRRLRRVNLWHRRRIMHQVFEIGLQNEFTKSCRRLLPVWSSQNETGGSVQLHGNVR